MGEGGKDGPAKEAEAVVVTLSKPVVELLTEAGELLFAVEVVVSGVPLVTFVVGAGAGAASPCCRCLLPPCKKASRNSRCIWRATIKPSSVPKGTIT